MLDNSPCTLAIDSALDLFKSRCAIAAASVEMKSASTAALKLPYFCIAVVTSAETTLNPTAIPAGPASDEPKAFKAPPTEPVSFCNCPNELKSGSKLF